MFITLDPEAGRLGAAWRRFSRSAEFKYVRAAFLCFALLLTPVPVFGVIVPLSYSVTLAWNPSISTNVVGYKVYYGLASGAYNNTISVGSSTNATITGLIAGSTYFFAATAVDSLGDESPFSNETSYTPGVAKIRVYAAPAGQRVLTVSGLIGQTYEIEATQDFETWTIIGTVTLGAGGSVDFTDADAANIPQRFYRTLEIR